MKLKPTANALAKVQNEGTNHSSPANKLIAYPITDNHNKNQHTHYTNQGFRTIPYMNSKDEVAWKRSTPCLSHNNACTSNWASPQVAYKLHSLTITQEIISHNLSRRKHGMNGFDNTRTPHPQASQGHGGCIQDSQA